MRETKDKEQVKQINIELPVSIINWLKTTVGNKTAYIKGVLEKLMNGKRVEPEFAALTWNRGGITTKEIRENLMKCNHDKEDLLITFLKTIKYEEVNGLRPWLITKFPDVYKDYQNYRRIKLDIEDSDNLDKVIDRANKLPCINVDNYEEIILAQGVVNRVRNTKDIIFKFLYRSDALVISNWLEGNGTKYIYEYLLEEDKEYSVYCYYPHKITLES